MNMSMSEYEYVNRVNTVGWGSKHGGVVLKDISGYVKKNSVFVAIGIKPSSCMAIGIKPSYFIPKQV
jgi:hypothetical protein